jgi:hypothetical protein
MTCASGENQGRNSRHDQRRRGQRDALGQDPKHRQTKDVTPTAMRAALGKRSKLDL